MPTPDFLDRLSALEDPFEARRRQRRDQQQEDEQLTPAEPAEPDLGFAGHLTDIGLGFGRGIESTFRGVYGLTDVLLFDSLPDLAEPLLGRSRTVVGGIVETMTSFLIPFMGATAFLRGGAVIGGAARLPGLSSAAQTTATTAGQAVKAGGIALGRDTLAGAVSDLLVFDGHEQRLSNLIERYPNLANPLTEFLAADPEDSEIGGRLKNVLEGSITGGVLGSLFEALPAAMSAVKFSRTLKEKGIELVTQDEAIRAVTEAVEPVKRAVRNADDEFLNAHDDAADAVLKKESPFTSTGKVTPAGSPIEAAVVDGETRYIARFPARGEGRRKMWFEVDENGTPVDGVYARGGAPKGPALGETRNRALNTLELRAEEARAKDISGVRADELQLEAGGDEGLETVQPGPGPLFRDSEWKQVVADIQKQDPEASAVNPRKLTAQELEDALLQRDDLNLSRAPGDSSSVIRVAERRIRETADPESWTNDELITRAYKDMSDMLDMDPEAYAAMQATRLGEAENLTIHTLATKFVLRKQTDDFMKLMKGLQKEQDETGELSLRSYLQWKAGLEDLTQTTRHVKGLVGWQGRALQSGRVPYLDAEQMASLVVEKGGKRQIDGTMKRLLAAYGDGGVEGAAAALKAVEGLEGRFMDSLTEYWMNSILSGLRTQSVNVLSNTMLSFYRPFELMAGALITGSSDELAEAAGRVAAMIESIPEAFRAANRSLKTGNDIFGVGGRATETATTQRAISAANYGIKDPIWGSVINTVGSVVRIPSGTLGYFDQVAKHMNFRGTAKSALRLRAKKIFPRQYRRQEAWVRDAMSEIVRDDQAYSKDALISRFRDELQGQPGLDAVTIEEMAIKKARDTFESDRGVLLRKITDKARSESELVTHTARLGARDTPGEKFTAGFQNWMLQHPTMRFLFPFVRTPFKIAQFASDRTIDPAINIASAVGSKVFPERFKNLNIARSKFLRDVIGEGASEFTKADAAGRFVTGASFFAGFSTMAHQGVVSGGGPRDSEQRQLLEATGWAPYSIKVGDGWVSYQRLDPFAIIIGLAADLVTAGKWSPAEDQSALEDAGNALMISLTKNITNKTYLTGLKNVSDALSDPERAVPKLLNRYAGSFVPTGPAQIASGVLTGVTSDPNLREVRNMLDAIMAKIPYYSTTRLDPVRNFLGEPVRRMRSIGAETFEAFDAILPIAYREVSDDLINNEMANLSWAFQPPQARIGAIDLRETENENGQSAYDRMLELRGEVRVRGKDLRRSLRELIRSRPYQSFTPQSTLEAESPRIQLINSVINEFQSVAAERMRREFPQVDLALQLQRHNRQVARRGF